MQTVLDFIVRFFRETVFLFNEMAIYLLLGFGIAGLIHAFLPRKRIEAAIGKPGMLASVKASLLGIPLPLCSCGVIPTALSLRNSGATKGATVSFLISTPQTGVDSIAATWSMLGPIFAIFRPVVAFITGSLGGFLTDAVEPPAPLSNPVVLDEDNEHRTFLQRIRTGAHYGFMILLGDIARWVILGLVLGGLIATVLPPDFFERTIGSPVLAYGLVLLASVPIYVCATGSIPVALALVMKGLSPGAAFVFLMAGPATNAASLTVLWKTLGRRATILFLLAIIGGAVGGGIVFDVFFRDAFQQSVMHIHGGNGWFFWFKVAGSSVLAVLLAVTMWKSIRPAGQAQPDGDADMTFQVNGMTCNNCRLHVEKAVRGVAGVEDAQVTLADATVRLKGNPDPEELKRTLDAAGYPVR